MQYCLLIWSLMVQGLCELRAYCGHICSQSMVKSALKVYPRMRKRFWVLGSLGHCASRFKVPLGLNRNTPRLLLQHSRAGHPDYETAAKKCQQLSPGKCPANKPSRGWQLSLSNAGSLLYGQDVQQPECVGKMADHCDGKHPARVLSPAFPAKQDSSLARSCTPCVQQLGRVHREYL